jgi:hypothetical protein
MRKTDAGKSASSRHLLQEGGDAAQIAKIIVRDDPNQCPHKLRDSGQSRVGGNEKKCFQRTVD